MKVTYPVNGGILTDEQELSIYRTMIDISRDIAFEWDFTTDKMYLSKNWEERFGYPPASFNYSDHFSRLSNFHPEDRKTMWEIVEQLRRGMDYGEAVVRILDNNDGYSWNRIRATAQFTPDGKLAKVLGIIVDIDTEQRVSQALMEKVEQDSLTGLLNKDSARIRVEKFFSGAEGGQHGAMLVIDLDNFKAINDHYGHMFGDAVLNNVAAAIRKLFRESDILARIGGDEFLVFMRNLSDRNLLQQRCTHLIQTIQQLYRQQNLSYHFSCSIGIALAPEHGDSYKALFQRADRALYLAKSQGKNTFAFFSSGADMTFYDPDSSDREESGNHFASAWGSLAMHMLQLHYESGDLASTLEAGMRLMGQKLQAEQLFLVTFPPNTYNLRWYNPNCNRDGEAKPLVLPLTREMVAPLFNSEDIFYCFDSSILPPEQQVIFENNPVKAALLRAIRVGGVLQGYVGMKSHYDTRLWTQKDIDALVFLSHLTAVFLLNNQ